jgi:hypothetical protein
MYLFLHRICTTPPTRLFGMTNLNANSKASASDTHSTFEYILTLLDFFWIIFDSGLNMNTCTE